jgi:hypothetical protein
MPPHLQGQHRSVQNMTDEMGTMEREHIRCLRKLPEVGISRLAALDMRWFSLRYVAFSCVWKRCSKNSLAFSRSSSSTLPNLAHPSSAMRPYLVAFAMLPLR